MNVAIVYDGGDISVPPSMGYPKKGQLEGTPLERLGELACRICYDSLGSGRTSSELHQHIRDVVNLSVYEHCVITVSFGAGMNVIGACLNRRGVFVEQTRSGYEVTANLRAIIEWDRYTRLVNEPASMIGESLRFFAAQVAPQIIAPSAGVLVGARLKKEQFTEDQAHVSMWMRGSRGWSHEQVRHRYAVSQRSTRYVDESESPWVMHRMITTYLGDASVSPAYRELLVNGIAQAERTGRVTYDLIVDSLMPWLAEKGMGKTDARKATRGAARGYLGNALSTEMIFTASIAGWKDMMRQRLSPLVDAEIQRIYTDVQIALTNSRYGYML